MSQLIMAEGAAPSTPSTGKATIHIDANGNLCKTDDAGNTMTLACAGDFTLTIPATGTAALLGTAQTFTAAQTLDKVIAGAGADLTIASGVITVTHLLHRIDTEGAGATDDLATINGGTARQILILEPVSSSRDVTVKHGTGNIFLTGAADFLLDNVRAKLVLLCNTAATEWHEIGRNDSA
jgi:hypothetical protein